MSHSNNDKLHGKQSTFIARAPIYLGQNMIVYNIMNAYKKHMLTDSLAHTHMAINKFDSYILR